MQPTMKTSTYALSGLHCNACVKRVSAALAPLAESVQVSLEPMQVVLTGVSAPIEQLQTAVALAGNYGLQLATELQTMQDKAQKTALQTYWPLLLIFAFIGGGSVLLQVGQHADLREGLGAITGMETMRYFMAGFFLVFAFFKLLDIQAFADAYAGYDLLAGRWRAWGLIYPFVELGLGIAYLVPVAPVLTAWVTIVVMGFSALGVILAVVDKRSIRCACLGSVFNLPMSTVTIVEDGGMVLMALWMLAM